MGGAQKHWNRVKAGKLTFPLTFPMFRFFPKKQSRTPSHLSCCLSWDTASPCSLSPHCSAMMDTGPSGTYSKRTRTWHKLPTQQNIDQTDQAHFAHVELCSGTWWQTVAGTSMHLNTNRLWADTGHVSLLRRFHEPTGVSSWLHPSSSRLRRLAASHAELMFLKEPFARTLYLKSRISRKQKKINSTPFSPFAISQESVDHRRCSLMIRGYLYSRAFEGPVSGHMFWSNEGDFHSVV